ncbi:MAG: membrane protein insertase YidC [Nitrospirales bacterium]|nr:membrane protein insertase YidC [Nitrospirales bacterium]
MEKRVVVFLILSLAIIIGYDYVLKQAGILPPPVESDQLPASNSSASKPQESAAPTADKKTSIETARTLTTTSTSGSQIAPAEPTSEEQTQEVVTDLFRAVFSNRGAVLTSWELKRYTTTDKEHPQPIQMVYHGGKFRKPLSLQVTDPALSTQMNEGLYEIQRDFSTLDATHPTGHLIFTYADPQSGLRAVKELTFHHDTYVVDIAVRTEGVSGPVDVVLGTNFGIVEWGEGFIGLIGPATKVDDQIAKDTPDAETERKGSVGWVALQDKYFLSVLIPTGASSAVIKKEGDKLFSSAVRYAAPSSTAALMSLYAGPKEFDTLKSFNIGLEDTIDFGWFIYGSWGIVKAVAKPLFSVLRFIHDYTHNYGVAIILLTVSIKLLFVPLQYKSYKSMKDMQLVQPKVAALQTKYKDDRERLNKELIKLYRDHKVNPVGGCLPMVLQMPVFVALFNILYMTIDLRQAPFFLWITDLSAQDPYYVLPIIMGISMVIQQKIMPTTMDPTQAKIMLLLPAFMTLLFLSFPAGLVLYWLTNNVITITQQFVTDRYIFKKRTTPSSSESALTSSAEDGHKSSNKKKKIESAAKQPVSANLDQPDA